jgi:folate-dependent phosphoribosylglycinamide formyltransferase PurN/peptidoglycan/xylan/chitin deacetylase (PgdA/CDA1 family)
MAQEALRVLVITSLAPVAVARLVQRLHDEVPEARIVGILYERRRRKTLRQRLKNFWSNVPEPGFLAYAAERVWGGALGALTRLGDAGLRLLHGTAFQRKPATAFCLDDLERLGKALSFSRHVTTDLHNQEALAFVRDLQPDLGIIYGTRILKPSLFEIPSRGCINIHKRKVPDYRGGGPIGLWEMLDGQKEIGITVHRVTKDVDEGAVIRAETIPIEPFDTLTSLALKADVVGQDALVRVVADFARGTVQETRQTGTARVFRNPKPHELRRYQKQLMRLRPVSRPSMGRPVWKLLARSLVLAPVVAARNWYYRWRGRFPVMVLYHHLVSDRPHPLGISTQGFLRQVRFLGKHYDVVDLERAIEMLDAGVVKRPTVVLTLDDGYQDNFLNLRAVVEESGVPITLFVCTQKLTTQEAFPHDREWGYLDFRPLTWEQAQILERSGFRIGGHTRSHFDCGSEDEALLADEIAGCRADLAERLGHDSAFFSFPYGGPANISPQAVQIARSAFRHICSACWGENRPGNGVCRWHLYRCPQPNALWPLELTLQSVLDSARRLLVVESDASAAGSDPENEMTAASLGKTGGRL